MCAFIREYVRVSVYMYVCVNTHGSEFVCV